MLLYPCGLFHHWMDRFAYMSTLSRAEVFPRRHHDLPDAMDKRQRSKHRLRWDVAKEGAMGEEDSSACCKKRWHPAFNCTACESYLHHLGGSCCTWVQLLCGILAAQLEKPFEVYTITLEVSDLNMRGRQMTMKRRALEATGSLG